MESKTIKSSNLKPATITELEQKIIKLQIQIERLQHKILQLDTVKLKQEQKIIRLQVENKNLKTENEKLKEEITLPANIHTAIAAIKGLKHYEPPKK
jgi:division protein CdvB (Snf7/Vps24/ESCRT-III family)